MRILPHSIFGSLLFLLMLNLPFDSLLAQEVVPPICITNLGPEEAKVKVSEGPCEEMPGSS